MTEDHTDPLVGTIVDSRYRVISRLARGGMSTVYRAVDTRLDRNVALKVLYPHFAEDPEITEAFEQEAKTAARLSHPNVVSVYDQGVDHSVVPTVAYLAMEYVPGFTMRTVLRQHGRLRPRLALVYATAMLEGLSAAHQAGLIHRDIKPENVLVSRQGQITVADFGLARVATNHTGTGSALMGTVAYVSPELVSGGKADARSDVYAMGIMLYEMLTGVQPFVGGTSMQVALQHVQSRVPAPSERVPGLAESLDDVVLWATHPDPAQRPSDARELLNQLVLIRQRLTDAELDFEPLSDDSADNTDSTEVITSPYTLSAQHDATQVMHSTPAAEPDNHYVVERTEPSQRSNTSARSRRREARKPTMELRPTRPLRALLITTLVVITSAAAVLAGWWFGVGALQTQLVIPHVQGKTSTAVMSELDQMGLPYRVSAQNDAEASANTVLDISPAAGTSVTPGTAVELTISETSAVPAESEDTPTHDDAVQSIPNLQELSLEQAKNIARDNGFAATVVRRAYSNIVPEGTVVSHYPEPGSIAKPGHVIEIVLSQGAKPVTVPNLVGLTRDDAVHRLEELGLKTQEWELPGNIWGAHPDSVRAHYPGAGQQIPAGSEVQVVTY